MGRKLGQHFLRNQHVLERITAAAELRPGDAVLEVGPGEGVLTEHLLGTGAQLTSIELDHELMGPLQQRFAGAENFRLLEGDVLKTDLTPAALFEPLRPHPTQYTVAANLPYYVSTPILFRLWQVRQHIKRLVLMVQKEVALRLAATPEEGKAYGSLSVAGQYGFEIRYLFTVPPGDFSPPPKVDSGVIALIPKPSALPMAQEEAYLTHLKQLFSARRKVMLSTLKKHYPHLAAPVWETLAEELGKKRPEVLTPAEHLAVFQTLIQGN